MAADFEYVRALARALPGTDEGTSYSTAALKVRGKLFARIWEDSTTLVLKCSYEDRDFLLHADPAVFYITDHYRDYPWVLVRLPKVRRTQLRELLEVAWRSVAPKRSIAELDRGARRRRSTPS
jgi:hypothetical protein